MTAAIGWSLQLEGAEHTMRTFCLLGCLVHLCCLVSADSALLQGRAVLLGPAPPVDLEFWVAGLGHGDAVLEAVEAVGQVRALPAQVQRPPDLAAHVVQRSAQGSEQVVLESLSIVNLPSVMTA